MSLPTVNPRQRIRKGFSLMELLLVLAVLAIVMAIAMPTYQGMIVSARLQQSAEKLELEMKRARVAAIRTGQAQVFRFQIGGGAYESKAWLGAGDSLNASGGATVQNEAGMLVKTASDGSSLGLADGTSESGSDQKLADGIVFAAADTLADSRTTMEQSQTGQVGAVGGWSTPILFYPDGTATTAEIKIQDANGGLRAIQLRGLTGHTRIIKPQPVVQ